MRKMKTYFIDFHKIISLFFILLFIIFMLILFKKVFIKDIFINIKKYTLATSNIIEYVPELNRNLSNENKDIKKIISFVLCENLSNPSEILNNNLCFTKSIKEKLATNYNFVNESNKYFNIPFKKKIAETKDYGIKYNPAIETSVKSVFENKDKYAKKGITIKNTSGYPINIERLYNEPLYLKNNGKKPEVLIIHAHGTESYNPTDRNKDIEKNVVRIGSEMTEVLKKNNITVHHCLKMHDIPKFNNSYRNTLITINEILQNNPNIKIVLDIHRDAMIKEDGTPYKVVADVNGIKSSQVMLVVGTNKGGLKHDNWKENLKFAIHCQEEINKVSKNLARPINLREERFNQHATFGSLIIEVGTNGNTLNEAVTAGKAAAEAISNVINKL